ncbi:MAG TPA: CBS domain-containing protein, partial [Candidatus Nitrosotenuis sp.]|nr:CBS domain-containing protein [Candidatus Nitrosotenuis sp.]
MRRPVITVRADQGAREAAELLLIRRLSGAPVLDEAGHLVGVVSLADLARMGPARPALVPVQKGAFYYRSLWPRHMVPFDPEEEERDERFRLEDFADEVRVQDVMTPAAFTVSEDAPLEEAADMMVRGGIHRLVVTRGPEVVGIVTPMDLLPVLQRQPECLSLPVSRVMQPHVFAVPRDMPARELVEELLLRGITGAPVVDAAGQPVGVVSLTDLAAWATRPPPGHEGEACHYVYNLALDPEELVRSFSVEDPGPTAGELMTPMVVKLDEDQPLSALLEL